jgi:uncharacterized protein (TIGR00251 family)
VTAQSPSGPLGLDIRESEDGVTLRVRVQPRASREAVGGTRGGALLVRLTAPPVEGAANAALLKLLAKTLRLPPSALTVARGARGRDKLVHVAGLRAADVAALLPGSGRPSA